MTISTTHMEILLALARYKYLCTIQIHTLFFADKTLRNTQNHLKTLADKNLIQSDYLPITRQTRNLGKVCYLTSQGAKVVEDELFVRNQEMSFTTVSKPIQSANHYYHRKKLIDVQIQLDRELLELPQLRLKELKTEARQAQFDNGTKGVETLIQGPEFKLIPDMTVVLQSEKTGGEAVFFIEIDTGKELIGGKTTFAPVGSLVDKFLKYQKLRDTEVWKENIDTSASAFQVLTITEKHTFMHSMAKGLGKAIDEHLGLFLFSTFDQLEAGSMLQSPLWWNQENQAVQPLL